MRMSTSAPLAAERAEIRTPDGSDSTSPSGVNPRALEEDETFAPLLLRLPMDQLCGYLPLPVDEAASVGTRHDRGLRAN